MGVRHGSARAGSPPSGATMPLALIACAVVARELEHLARDAAAALDVRLLPQGLHERPDRLRAALQAEIDRLDADAEARGVPAGGVPPGRAPAGGGTIALAFGLCGTGTAGVRSARHRLVLPRAHDCATLVLGCRHRYRAAFDARPASYWCTPGWADHGALPSEERLERGERELAARHGHESAAYLLDLERAALARYERCAIVAWPELEHGEQREAARRTAAERGWGLEELPGDPSLLADLVAGRWDERFLVLEPGQTAAPAADERVVVAA
jgi:hypothetical protein